MAKFDSPTDRMFQELGLMKPDGELTFDPTGGTGYIYDVDEEDDSAATRDFTVTEDGGLAGTIETRSHTPSQAKATVVTEPKQANASQWESDENPYKTRYTELAQNQPSENEVRRQNHDIAQQQLGVWAQQAYEQGVAMRDEQGNPVHDPKTLRMQILAAHDRVSGNLRLQYERELTMPVAIQYAAQDIANKHGQGKVKVEDLIGLPDASSMIAVAQHIAKNGGGTATAGNQSHNQQRDERFQARRESGVDTVETGSPLSRSVNDAFQKLSPKDKIAYSLTYQHGSHD